MSNAAAIRAVVSGDVQSVGFREATVQRAGESSVLGRVRHGEDGTVVVPAEGLASALEELEGFLHDGPPQARVERVQIDRVPIEGHEQFAIRGVSAGEFVVQEHVATAHHFDLRLEVDGVMRSWAIPKGPSLDPAVKRLALEVEDHDKAHNSFEGALDTSRVIVWDRGTYEQGGRVPWPQALSRGHAVFVLHGEKLHGGFALQRTRPGAKPQWLLIKRRDDDARPGLDVVAEAPRSVLSGRTLDELTDDVSPARSSSGRQGHYRDDAIGPGRILGELRLALGLRGIEAVTFLAGCLADRDVHGVGPDLDADVGLRLQVVVPVGPHAPFVGVGTRR